MSDATIGSALTQRRQEIGISKVQAAQIVGMSRTTYSSYERDAQRPSAEVFPALAMFLNMTVEELLVLYGATAVAALRPSLERVLSELDVRPSHATGSNEEQAVPNEPHWLGSATPIQSTPDVPDVPDVHRVPDVPDVHRVPDVPDVHRVPDVPDVSNFLEVPNFLDEKFIPSIRTGEEKQVKKKKRKKKKKGKS